LETPRANLHAILHHLNTSYTNYFNIKHQRAGHLFQGRYRAILVEKDAYALELSRYIHLNPVRAQLIENPRQYPWSSYFAYVNGDQKWSWLHTGFILSRFGASEDESRNKYEDFVADGIQKTPPDPLKNVVASTLLGSDKFIEWVKEKWVGNTEMDRDLPALRKLSIQPDLSSIVMESEKVFGSGTIESRRVALYLSHRLSGLPLKEIGKYFDGISSSGVSQNTRRLEEQMKEDRMLFEKVNQLKGRVSQ
jgi:hypothetical protein